MKGWVFFFLTLLGIVTFSIRNPNANLIQVREHGRSSQCDSLMAAIDELSSGFDCVKARCSGGGGSGSTESPPLSTKEPPSTTKAPPTPPETEPTDPPPLPTESVEDSTTEAAEVEPSDNVQVGSYIPNWFVYKKHYMGMEKKNVFGGVSGLTGDHASEAYTFFAADLEAKAPQLTHLYYAFWNLNSDCQIEDSDPDASWNGAFKAPSWIKFRPNGCQGLMNDMMGLKSRFTHLKLLVSVGGWTYSQFFTKCAASKEGRDKIIKSLKFYLDAMDPNWGKSNGIWDGVDLDWEFPAAKGLHPDNHPDDWFRFTDLTRELRSAAKSEGRNSALITCAISTGETLGILLKDHANTKAFCDAMDFINVMTYDIHGKWDETTGHNAPFCESKYKDNPSQPIWISNVFNNLENAGCPMKKLMLGLPNYAPAWTYVPPGPNGNGLFSTSTKTISPDGTPLWAGWSTFSDADDDLIPQGLVTWWDLKETVSNSRWGFEIHKEDCPVDHGVVVPLKWVYSEKEQAFACYDDPDVMKAKTTWARARGLGGFFFWDAQQDKHGELLGAAREGWGGLPLYDEGSSRPTCYDSKKPDFSLDPLTGKPRPIVCKLTNRKSVIKNGDSCNAVKQRAYAECSAGAVVVGGSRSGESKCQQLCGENFGPSPSGLDPWPGDTIYFRCKDELLG